MEMTAKTLRQLCLQNGLYGTPGINDKLYLHYKGFSRIQCLDNYTGVKVLWLEGNGIAKIEGLSTLTELRTLFLHENMIEVIEGLDACAHLDLLNLANNFVARIDGLTSCLDLTSLNMAHNRLSSREDIAHILHLPKLQTLDLQHNKINDVAALDVLADMPDLRVLYLMGNPIVKSIPHYRKTVVGRLRNLRYLDERPVFPEERRRVDKWYAAYLEKGADAAAEAERAELLLIRQEKDAADESNFRAFEELMRQGKETRQRLEKEKENLAQEGAADSVAINAFSGEAIVNQPESAVLREEREKRWGQPAPATSGGRPRFMAMLDEASGNASEAASNVEVTEVVEVTEEDINSLD
jgi:dynein assembly factor 1, axonemal